MPQKTRFYEMNDPAGKRIRIYENDGAFHSAVYLEKGMHFEPVFQYMKTFDTVLEAGRKTEKILLIGGAGYAWPKDVLSRFPGISMTVVDIDPRAWDNAMEHFFLNELLEAYHPDLIQITDDGRHFLETTEELYDMIVNDAYAGSSPVPSLLTEEACRTIRRRLKKDGIYMANLHGYTRLKLSYQLLDALYTASTVFRNVCLLPCSSAFTGSYRTNYVMAAFDQNLSFPDAVPFSTRKCRLLSDRDHG
jgi:spermidine synthase